MMSLLISQDDGPVARVRLNRPEIKNAFNGALIADLSAAFKTLERDSSIRAVILSGEGDCFCAGADLNWMKSMAGSLRKSNEADARALAKLLAQIDCFPKPVIGRIHGAAIGGGMGLVAVCDIAVAAEGTVFGLSEVKLGLAPAVISPFVISKIGVSQARRYFLTGERFKTETALKIGFIHEAVPLYSLEARVEEMAREILSSGPEAVKACKDLIRRVGAGSPRPSSVQEYTAKKIATLRVSPEGQEGMKAFLEKRKPIWSV